MCSKEIILIHNKKYLNKQHGKKRFHITMIVSITHEEKGRRRRNMKMITIR